MNVSFDGFGIVNNRGASKYWGVCEHQYLPGRYRITVNSENDDTVTYHFDQNKLPLNEENVAYIASHLYQFRHGTIPTYIDVDLGSDGTYRLDKVNKKIYPIIGEPVYTVSDDFEAHIGVASSPVPAENEELDINPDFNDMIENFNLTVYEQGLLGDVFDALIEDRLTPKAKKILTKLVDILN
jgi:hypothetical protein